MGFTESIKTVYNKYAEFEGTASRSEFWWFYLYNWILSLLSSITIILLPALGIVFCLLAIGTIIPYAAVSVRRMHDLNYSGWRILWGFIPLFGTILLIVWYSKEGNQTRSNNTEFNTLNSNPSDSQRDKINISKPKDNNKESQGKTKFR
jgi:uncharacterized membrane protein YhaH (DUF805 family)